MSLIAYRKEEGGFTMVEVMVVILIIGILAAIAIPLYLEQRKAAYEAVLKTDLRNVGIQVASTHDFDSEGFLEPLPVRSMDEYNPDPDKYLPVILSDGVRINFKPAATGFCITGLHDSNPTNTWAFSTALGGLTKDLATCVNGIGAYTPPPSTGPVPEVTTEPTADPSDPITDPSAPEVTGDIETDPPLGVQCFHEMITVTRYFNEFITYRTPESMMLYVAYQRFGSYSHLNSTYWNHPDTVRKQNAANVLNPYRNHEVYGNPDVLEQHQALNVAMYDRYDYWREDEMLEWYMDVIEEEIRKGQDPRAAPNQTIRDAFADYVHYFHQWNYIQCGEYAFPGYGGGPAPIFDYGPYTRIA